MGVLVRKEYLVVKKENISISTKIRLDSNIYKFQN